MKKVVTINLGGNAYQLDEDGYEALMRYLESAEARLQGNPDISEIMIDLELAIADKASRFLNSSKSVVSGAEVEQIITEMGPVDAPLDDEQAADAGEEAPVGGEVFAREPRKLYRLTGHDEKMVAGVCAGLAAYFGIDVSILRIIVILLAIASAGAAVVGYLLLIVVIPAATTPEQHAAAYGVPFDAQAVIDQAKSKLSEFSDGRNAGLQRRGRRQRGPRARGPGQELFRWLLIAILAGFALVLAMSFLNGLFRMFNFSVPNSMGMYRYYGGSSFPEFLILVLAIGFLVWLLGRRPSDGSTFMGSVLVATVQLIAVIGLLWVAYHTFSFVRHIVDGSVMAVHGILA